MPENPDTQSSELALAKDIIATLREPFLVLDRTLRVQIANAAFYRTFHSSEADTAGRFIYDLGNGQWDIPALRTLLEDQIPEEIAVHDFEVEHDFPEIGPRSMILNARRFPPEGENPTLVLLAIEDLTRRKRADADLKGSELRGRPRTSPHCLHGAFCIGTLPQQRLSV